MQIGFVGLGKMGGNMVEYRICTVILESSVGAAYSFIERISGTRH
jgi:hypothetical protein